MTDQPKPVAPDCDECSKCRRDGCRSCCYCNKRFVMLSASELAAKHGFKETGDFRPDKPVAPPKRKRRDGADEIAERLYDMACDGKPGQEVVESIAAELRKAAQGPRKWGILR